MARRRLWLVLAALSAAIALAVAVDALLVSDEERLESFIEDVTGEVSGARIGEALGWTDPARMPVEVDLRGRVTVYDASDPGALERDARRALGRFEGAVLRVWRQSIEVEGDRADVSLELLSDRGRARVSYRLRRRAEADHWLVDRVRLR